MNDLEFVLVTIGDLELNRRKQIQRIAELEAGLAQALEELERVSTTSTEAGTESGEQ